MIARGIFRFGGAVLVGRLFQLAAFAVLVHELSPEQMGVVALLTAVFIGFHSLTNFGFDRYIIYANAKSAGGISDSVNVIWTLQLLRGSGIFLFSGFAALCINSFSLFEIDVVYFLGIGAALLIGNLINPHIVIHEREGNFDYVARMRGASATVSGLSVMLMAFVWADPWAYVIGQIVNATVYALLTFRYSETLPIISFDKQVVIEVFDYCKHLLLMAVVSFIAVQFENFYVGFMFGPVTLGLYFTWARIIQLPREIVAQITESVLFSRACNLKREGGDVANLHLVGLAVSMMTIVPFYVFMWNHGDWLIDMIAGSEWVEYWWAGKYFVLISFFHLLSSTIGPFTLSRFPKLASRLRTVESLGLVLLMAWLGQAYGIEGVLIAAFISNAAGTLIRAYILYGKIVTSNRLRHGMLSVAISTAIILPLLAGEYLLAESKVGMALNGSLLAFYCLGYMAVGLVVLLFSRRILGRVV